MLQLASDFDQTTRIDLFLAGHLAYDPQTGASLHRGRGQRKLGRPQRYVLVLPSQGAREHIMAYTDAAAVEKARARLAAVRHLK